MRSSFVCVVLWPLALVAQAWAQEDLPGSAATDGPDSAHAPPPEPAKPESASGEKSASGNHGLLEDLIGFPIRGRFALRYRARWLVSDDDGSKDQDLYEDFSLDVGNPKKHLLTAALSLHASQDLDGEHREDDYFVFDGITDTYRSRWHGLVSYAYVDVNRLGPVERARAGRQTLRETPALLYFDGLSAQSLPWEKVFSLQGGLYGGIPVHTWESNWHGDAVLGAWIQARPFTGNRVRLDYSHIRDRYRDERHRDNLWGLQVWQRIAGLLTLSGEYTRLENRSRDLRFRADFYHADWDTRVTVSFYRLCRRQVEQSIDTDFFRFALGEYLPYNEVRALAAQGIGDHVVLQAGAEMREVDSWDDEGPGNRSWQRCFVTPVVNDWPLKGLSASVTGEYWNVKHTQDGDTWSAGADLSWKPIRELAFAVGSSYALYKFDVFEDIERERVRTVFGKVTLSPARFLKFEVSYELEHFKPFDDGSNYFQTVRALAAFTF